MALEKKFDLVRRSIVECDKALRELEQRSKVVTQHVDTSVFVVKSREDRATQGLGQQHTADSWRYDALDQ